MAPRFLVTLGVLLVLLGLAWPLLQRWGLGRLPGDFVWEGRGFTVYFPLATSLIVSLALTLLLWLLRK
ncbi:MAG TPA: DUF2905 domain-containing protein [Gammaproteobacteria bacterium]|nr:DUF2905 domain-containing protein [Gammaproteobacteria bacterium]